MAKTGSKKGSVAATAGATATAEPGPLAVKVPATPGATTATAATGTAAGSSSSTAGGGATPPGPNTPQTGVTATTVLAKSAKVLEFNLRGGTTQVIAATWEQLVSITENEWDDIERTIAEYEAQGPTGAFQVDWLKVLSTAARKEFLTQHQYRCAVGKDETDVFDNTKYETKDQIERLRHVVEKDLGHRRAEPDLEDQKLQAVSAVAAWIKTTAAIVPAKDASDDYFIKDVRAILAKYVKKGDQDLDLLNDADLAESQGVVRELLARINAPDPGNAIWLQAFGEKIKDLMTAKAGKIHLMDIVKTHNKHIFDLKEEIKALNARLPKEWQTGPAKGATTGATGSAAAAKAHVHAVIANETTRTSGQEVKKTEIAPVNYTKGSNGGYRDYDRGDRATYRDRRQSYGGGGYYQGGGKQTPWQEKSQDETRARSSSRDRQDRRSRSRSPGGTRKSSQSQPERGRSQQRGDSKDRRDQERPRSRSRSPGGQGSRSRSGSRDRGGGGRGRGRGGGRGSQGYYGPRQGYSSNFYYSDQSLPVSECNGCGSTHPGGRPNCAHKIHPDFNAQKDVAWADSVTGQRLSKLGYHRLQPGKRTVTYTDGTVQLENFEVDYPNADDSTKCIDLAGKILVHEISEA